MQHFQKVLIEFSNDVVEANGGTRVPQEPQQWPASWGTAGEPSQESPFAWPNPCTRTPGQHVKHTAILSLEDSKKMDLFFHASGPDFHQSCKSYMRSHPFGMFRVPLPDLPVQGVDGSGEDTAVDCSLITGPKVEWLPVVGVMWLHALAKCAVCYPQ